MWQEKEMHISEYVVAGALLICVILLSWLGITMWEKEHFPHQNPPPTETPIGDPL